MVTRILTALFAFISRIGASADDSDETRLQKTLLNISVCMILPAGLIWGTIYALFREPIAASIPYIYSVLSFISILVFAFTRRYRFYLFAELLLILLLPFSLLVALGGFINSSAVVLWSILCPIGALLFDEPRKAWRWFAAYLGLVLLSAFLRPYFRVSNNLSPSVVLVFFVLNIGAISSVAFVLLQTFVGQKEVALGLLRLEQEKTESLLLNILPKEIAAILKNEQRTIADSYEGASILFADLVGFTPLSVEMAPKEMVELLNEVFSHFDSLVEKYDVEKIRTIGDNYMVAAGVPRRRPDHAQALARMALDMRDYLRVRPPHNGKRLDFRIGINSGPVVGGVIGRKKFVFDLWGEAVNIASRMESQGEPGQIQITRDTRDLLKEEFVYEPRGTLSIKGKGEMETFYLVLRKDE